MPEPCITDIALCFVIDAVNNDNNALTLFMLLNLITSQLITLCGRIGWLVYL